MLPDFESPNSGFQGFLDLTAGRPDSLSGLAFFDITASSEFLYVDLNPGAAFTFCLRPVGLPIARAGVVSCTGGRDLGETVSVDHRLGTVGFDGFTVEACNAAGGTIEGETDPHPGVCNGPFQFGGSGEGNSGVGAVKIGFDSALELAGLPAEITIEASLPCGDEGPGVMTTFGLVSALSRAVIANRDAQPGSTLQRDERGENFSCHLWTQEDGPGRLVIALPAVHGFLGSDLINLFVWDD